MAATSTPSRQILTTKPCISSSHRISRSSTACFGNETKGTYWTKFKGLSLISGTESLYKNYRCNLLKFERHVMKATSEASDKQPLPGLPVDLRGKRAFIAGVADDNGYGWAIAKSLVAAGAEILVGTWVPALNIFESCLRRGKFDESRIWFFHGNFYPLNAVYDCPEDVPEDVKTNKRHSGSSNWIVKEAADAAKQDFGRIDILVHSLGNGPEVSKPLLETSRNGYLAAISTSSYSFVSLLYRFLPIINPGGATISLTYIASEKIVPGYGGGVSSAKAALESDTRVLAFEAGRKHNVRVNTISAGPLRSRAAKAIGFIDTMIE